MGGGSWKASDWDGFKSAATVDKRTGRAKSRDEIFSRHMRSDFDPKKIEVRESCDSADSPRATPVIVALDVTGSMHNIPDNLVRDGLGTMAKEIFDRQPVTNPQLMLMAVGDAYCDDAPLQVSQFEADIRIAEQLKDLWLEGGGGGNPDESYHLPWYFAARKTKIDSFDKRGEKGVLFTLGDEGVPSSLTRSHIEKVFGDKVQADIPTEELLRMVEERYDVFHLMIQQGHNYGSYSRECWKKLLGERVIPVSDYKKVPEIIVSTLEVIGGRPKADVTASWDGGTSLVVRDAIAGLTVGSRAGVITKTGTTGTPSVWRPGAPRPGGR